MPLLSRPFARSWDGDLNHGNRPVQRAWNFDPHWLVSFYYGCGNGPFGLSPWVARGKGTSGYTVNGTASLVPAPEGWALSVGVNATASFRWILNQTLPLTAGSFIGVTRMTSVLSTTLAQTLINTGAVGTNSYRFASNASTTITWGWNGPSNTTLTITKTGLVYNGNIAVWSMDWSPTGTRGYLNGILIGSNSTVPSTGDTNAANFYIGGVAATAAGWGNYIYQVVFLDRALDANEHAFISQNPFTWPFQPSLLRNAPSLPVSVGVPWGWEAAGILNPYLRQPAAAGGSPT